MKIEKHIKSAMSNYPLSEEQENALLIGLESFVKELEDNKKVYVGSGIEIIAEERAGHYEREGWTNEGDDLYVNGELASAAACYAVPTRQRSYISLAGLIPVCWPWERSWWKPSPDNRIKELTKAGALIAAEIDRLNRLNHE